MLAEAQRALAPVLGEPEGPPEPLGGGITNRNYRLRWGGRDCVLRLPGKDTELLGIDRRAEHEATRAAAAAGIGPDVVAFEPRLGCLVTAFVKAARRRTCAAAFPKWPACCARSTAGPRCRRASTPSPSVRSTRGSRATAAGACPTRRRRS